MWIARSSRGGTGQPRCQLYRTSCAVSGPDTPAENRGTGAWPGEGAGEALGAGLLAAGRAPGALVAVPAAARPALGLAQPEASSTAIPVPDTITSSRLATTTAYGAPGRPLPGPCCRKSIAPCEHCLTTPRRSSHLNAQILHSVLPLISSSSRDKGIPNEPYRRIFERSSGLSRNSARCCPSM